MATYLAFLRGINVGGNNIIKMTALKVCFESLGFADVRTYIQSGNVIFNASGSITALEDKIEQVLSKTFSYQARVVVVSGKDLKQVVTAAPAEFLKDLQKYRSDVIFLKRPLTPTKAMAIIELRDGVDRVYQGKHVLYFKRLTARATQSKLSKVIAKPEYKYMTIRNWNTVSKLLGLLEK
ncbi:MAG: DUF1697 domain-containing protein [Candidatus Buchananbacteria bacterium]|nr:DUF1697 domain-containing protein [Candidatus Buchananbacteria bacterium]